MGAVTSLNGNNATVLEGKVCYIDGRTGLGSGLCKLRDALQRGQRCTTVIKEWPTWVILEYFGVRDRVATAQGVFYAVQSRGK